MADEKSKDQKTQPEGSNSDSGDSGSQGQSKVDKWLEEYEKAQSTKSTQDTQDDDKGSKGQSSDVNARLDARDIADAVRRVKGDLNVPDAMIKGFLNAQAENESFQRAWRERDENPSAWDKAIDAARQDATKVFVNQKVDEGVTSSRTAVEASVKGSASAPDKSDEAPKQNYGGLSNNEFADQVYKDFGYRPQV